MPKVRGKCSLEDCEKPHYARSFCRAHYQRFMKTGSPGVPFIDGQHDSDECVVPWCENKRRKRSGKYCGPHAGHVARFGEPRQIKKRDVYVDRSGSSWSLGSPNKYGYVWAFLLGGGSRGPRIAFHRLVMQDVLGRELLPHENVHHINGVRDDNRPENLELWSSSQPKGQRVEDKLRWAREIIAIYGGGNE